MHLRTCHTHPSALPPPSTVFVMVSMLAYNTVKRIVRSALHIESTVIFVLKVALYIRLLVVLLSWEHHRLVKVFHKIGNVLMCYSSGVIPVCLRSCIPHRSGIPIFRKWTRVRAGSSVAEDREKEYGFQCGPGREEEREGGEESSIAGSNDSDR